MTGRSPESIDFGQFRFIPGDGLWRDGRPIPLPPRAIGVLTTLLESPGAVVSKKTLMDAVWPDTFVTESSLLEAIGLVRDVLGDDRKQPVYIQTIHRRGYRFIGHIAAASRDDDRGEALRPILIASAAYAITTICVAIVFGVLGQDQGALGASGASGASGALSA